VTTPGGERSRDEAHDRAARDEASYRRALAWLGVLALGLAVVGVVVFLIYATFTDVFGG
jgi:hypothetical protein